jgi:hypothetical protein
MLCLGFVLRTPGIVGAISHRLVMSEKNDVDICERSNFPLAHFSSFWTLFTPRIPVPATCPCFPVKLFCYVNISNTSVESLSFQVTVLCPYAIL